MSSIFGSGRTSLPSLSAAVTNGAGNFTTNTGVWYFWLQARNAIGYNLVSSASSVTVIANSVVQLTIPSDAYRSGEYWEEFYISASKVNSPNTACIICVVPAVNNLQTPIALPFTVNLDLNEYLNVNASVALPDDLPAFVVNGMLRQVSSLGAIFKYNAFSNTTVNGTTVIAPGNSLTGVWELFTDGYNINLSDLTSNLGCNQYITATTDLTRVYSDPYNPDGSAGFSRVYWILNTNAENIPKSTRVGATVYLNSTDVSSSLTGLFKLVFLGYSNLDTGLLDILDENNQNPMPGIGTTYNYSPNKTDLQLPKPLPENFAYVFKIYPEFSPYQLSLSLPNGSSLSILPYLYATQGIYNAVGDLLGDFISNDSGLRRALPRQGLSLLVLEGSGIVKNYQFNLAPKTSVFGLQPNLTNQKLIIDGNGSVYISSSPSNLESIRAIISTLELTSSVISLGNISGSNTALFTVSLTHPILTADNLAYINSAYLDVIAGKLAYFNPSSVRVFIKNNNTNEVRYQDIAIAPLSVSTSQALNYSTMTVTTEVISNAEGLFKGSNLTASSNDTGTLYTVYAGYHYNGNTVSNISHKSTGNVVVITELTSSFLTDNAQLARLRVPVSNLDELRSIAPIDWDIVEVKVGFSNKPALYSYNPTLSLVTADYADGFTYIQPNDSEYTGAYYLLTFPKGQSTIPVIGIPVTTLGNIGDIAFNETGQIYEKTATTVWTLRSNSLTQEEADSRYPLSIDSNPYPQYLTQAEGDARYPLISALSETIDDRVAALVLAGANITGTYNDPSNTLTIAASGGGASGVSYTYTNSAPPTVAGQIRSPQLTLNTATAIVISSLDIDGDSASDVTGRLKTGCIFVIAKNASNYVRFEVTEDYANTSVTVSVLAEKGTIESESTVYLDIVSDALVTTGGGIDWLTSTALSINAARNQGFFLNSTSTQAISLPGSPTPTDQFAAIGINSGLHEIRGGTFQLPDGTLGTGIRSVAGKPCSSIQLICYGTSPNRWAIQNCSDITHYELFTPAGGGSRPTDKNLLTYTATSDSGQVYFVTNTVAKLYDEIKTVPSADGSGMIAAPTSGRVNIYVTFSTPVFLNEIKVYGGQFNGPYTVPSTLVIYSGIGLSTPLFNSGQSANLSIPAEVTNNPPALTTIDLIGDSNFDTSSSTYTFSFFRTGVDYISVLELELFGGI
jgi:hypothetical protein